jgi:hypothetical protein
MQCWILHTCNTCAIAGAETPALFPVMITYLCPERASEGANSAYCLRDSQGCLMLICYAMSLQNLDPLHAFIPVTTSLLVAPSVSVRVHNSAYCLRDASAHLSQLLTIVCIHYPYPHCLLRLLNVRTLPSVAHFPPCCLPAAGCPCQAAGVGGGVTGGQGTGGQGRTRAGGQEARAGLLPGPPGSGPPASGWVNSSGHHRTGGCHGCTQVCSSSSSLLSQEVA